MRIGFFDFANWNYWVESPYEMPLGGSQSALCYLAESLAILGHEVSLFNWCEHEKISREVACWRLENLPLPLFKSLEYLIVLNDASAGERLRKHVGPRAKIILWTQHAHDQPAVACLSQPEARNAFDAVVLISGWQKECYEKTFGIEPAKTTILQNAASPEAISLFTPGEAILPAKSRPPVMAYSSTPFRGLNLLVDYFPEIRRQVPGTRLKVFSSMKVYQVADEKDEAKNGRLYERCRGTEGIEYIGSVPQPALARELKAVSVFPYPNTFAETSCIAVMEALSAGCSVVTSHLGALPETSGGFARLIHEPPGSDAYRDQFITQTVQSLLDGLADKNGERERNLLQQVQWMREQNSWPVRSQEWEEWLSAMRS